MTFIWNSEYEVYLANTDTEDGARNLIIERFIKDAEEAIKPEGAPLDYQTLLYTSRAYFNRMYELFAIMMRKPDFVIGEYTAKIYDHGNE